MVARPKVMKIFHAWFEIALLGIIDKNKERMFPSIGLIYLNIVIARLYYFYN
jgi:hypothetical protein